MPVAAADCPSGECCDRTHMAPSISLSAGPWDGWSAG